MFFIISVLFSQREGAVKQKRIAPSVPMSYQLSNTYIKHFRSEISLEVPDEALTCLKAIKQAGKFTLESTEFTEFLIE